MNRPLVFSTRAYGYMLADLCQAGGYEQGTIETATFPDGETYQRIDGSVDGRDVVILGGTVSEVDTLEIYDLAGTMVEEGARSLTLVVPYFGYSTMERATHPGEVVTAKSRARLLSSLPTARFGNRIVLFDLHTEGIPYYFEGTMRAFHLYGKPVIQDAARAIGGTDFVLACTDAGRAKWVESLANDLGVTASFVFKRRLSGERTEILAVSAQVQGKRVIIYDDMIRTGSSLMNAARAYMEAGATSIAAITTHGLFPRDALAKLSSSGLFSHIVCTDSHPRARLLSGGLVTVRPIAGLLAAFLAEHSISSET
ncbi:MAG: ribose-phosphate pyrophosphokinae [Acidimicrobiaceae bacterium]|nr:ribose-phosphate pyrophosphokinae [Acidimicrobiaceae bacterium]